MMTKTTTTLDLVFCLDCSGSIISYMNQIRAIILSILLRVPDYGEGNIRLILIEFRSDRANPTTRIHQFTSSVETFREWLENVTFDEGRCVEDSKAVVHALTASLAMDWRSDADADLFHEKLVILLTDGPPCGLLNSDCPCGSEDLWTVMNQFEEKQVTVAVVGVEPNVNICTDFYCALAERTGGAYLPLVNAAPILADVIDQAMSSEDTLSQAFRRVTFDHLQENFLYRDSGTRERVRFMMQECQTLSDIRRKMFTWRRRPPSPVVNEMIESDDDDDVFQPLSPPTTFYWDVYPFTSTPVTEDEGYRTRLPTMASSEPSLTQLLDSPALGYRTDSDLDIDIDDGVF